MRKIIFYIVLMIGLYYPLQSSAQAADSIAQMEKKIYEHDDDASVDTSISVMKDSSNTEEENIPIDDNASKSTETNTNDTSELRQITKEHWENILRDSSFVYTLEKEVKKNKKDKPFTPPRFDFLKTVFNATVFKVLLFGMVGFILLFILYYIFTNSEFNYFRSRRRKKTEVENIRWENVTQFSAWEKAVQEAEAIPDYRTAIQILYLQTLRSLNDKNIISYEIEKTNWEYVAELRETKYEKSFMQLTTYFDYIWYGHFTVNEEMYKKLKQFYHQFIQDLT